MHKFGNKKLVLKIHERTNKNKKMYEKYKLAFFIDRNFDISYNNVSSLPVYETPCYSIENFYTTKKTLKNILTNEFNLSEIDFAKTIKHCVHILTKPKQ